MEKVSDVQKSKEYTIFINDFEGPIDLLYQLIENRKMQINTISLFKITEDFLFYVRSVRPSVEEIAYFLHIASILILIKSKSLLPILNYTDEEDSDIRSLQERVRLYKYIQNAAMPALKRWKKYSFATTTPKKEKKIEFLPDSSCVPDLICQNAKFVIREVSFLKEPKRKKVDVTVRIEEIIEKVLNKVSERVQVSFNEMTLAANKTETVISFLAILELIRKNLLQFSQREKFGDILLYNEE